MGRHFAVESDKKMAISRMGTVVIFISVALLVVSAEEEMTEKRGGDRFFATGMGGRMNAQYAARRLHRIDGASARQRQKFFGKRLLADDPEESMVKRGGDSKWATGAYGRILNGIGNSKVSAYHRKTAGIGQKMFGKRSEDRRDNHFLAGKRSTDERRDNHFLAGKR